MSEQTLMMYPQPIQERQSVFIKGDRKAEKKDNNRGYMSMENAHSVYHSLMPE